jgi:endonuclease/exonuclease/phosphatase family metal-dependent hydrolase
VIVGTWNLENLFRPGTEGGPSDQDAYVAKLKALAAVIRAFSPDVLAVQEVGDAEALGDLVKRLDGEWRVELSQIPDGRGIRVGFVSKPAMQRVEQVHEFPDGLQPIQVDDTGTRLSAMGRGALRMRVRTEGRAIDLVTCHLKSKLLTFPGGRFNPHDENERARFAGYALNRRSAEAVTLRVYANGLLDGEGQQRSVILLGDLNDDTQAATTQLLLGPPGSEINAPGFGRADKGDGARLWNLAPLIRDERRYSRKFRGRGELIDHILVSHALVTAVDAVDTGPGEPPSITETPIERRDEPGSDHLPVWAKFNLG